MSYATPQDVADLFRSLDLEDSTAAVTKSKIQKWLDSASLKIDAKIGTLYQLPINNSTAPKSVKILAEIEAMKVAAIVDDILNTYKEADKKPNWEKRACMMLEELVPDRDTKTGKQVEPTMKLPDAVYTGTNEQKSSISVSATTGRIFEKGRDTW